MEIDFNPNPLPKPQAGQRVESQDTPSVASNGGLFIAAASLHDKFDSIPPVRPERMEIARTLAADIMYPPDYALDRIATLLAIHMT